MASSHLVIYGQTSFCHDHGRGNPWISRSKRSEGNHCSFSTQLNSLSGSRVSFVSSALAFPPRGNTRRRKLRAQASAMGPSRKRKSRKSLSEAGDEFMVEVSGLTAEKGLVVQGSLVELFGTWSGELGPLGESGNTGSSGPEVAQISTNQGTEGSKAHGDVGVHGGTAVAEDGMAGFNGVQSEAEEQGDLEEEEAEGEDWESTWSKDIKPEWKMKEDARSRWEELEEEEDIMRRWKLRNGREVFEERTFLMGVELKMASSGKFSIEESLGELSQLAETAGLSVVGSSYQRLEHPNPKTYIGVGKVAEVKAAIEAYGVETVIFDDELSPAQLRNLEKAFGEEVRVCDRTALILDIFSQRAATKEATLQVELAQTEYQLPRLTRMWTHLERQAGGLVKGMGEKQIEVDKRILRTRISVLKRTLETVREHRHQYRQRRANTPIPVISLVGYTNAGKSTLLNRLSGAGVLAEDKLFATLDPTTRRVELPNGKECLFTDTVGFIQKLPTQLVAAFRATLEEISDASLLMHVVDISHPMVEQQTLAVEQVLEELDVSHIPILTVWNKIDRAANPKALRRLAARRGDIVCISALSGEGMDDFYMAAQEMIKDLMVPVEAVIPYDQGELLNVIHRLGMVDEEEYLAEGTLVRAHVPFSLSRQLGPLCREQGLLVGGPLNGVHILPDLDISKIPGTERIIEIDS